MVRDRVVIGAIVLLTAAIHVMSTVTTSTDSAWTFHVAASMIRQHDTNLDEYQSLVSPQGDYRLRTVGGHLYYYYPDATPLLVTPALWLVNRLYPLSHPTDFYAYLSSHAPDERTARLEKVVASGFVALAAAVMYLVARRFLGIAESSAMALMFAFSTSMWSTASRALWQHGPSVLFLTLALYLTLSAENRKPAVFGIGLILGYAYLIRPTNSLSVAAFGLYFLVYHRNRVHLFVLGALAILVPYAIHNWLTYGNILPPYSYQLFQRLGTPADIAEGLAGTLVSPNRGLLIFTPLFAFSVYGASVSITRGPEPFSRVVPYLLAIVGAHWITTSLFEDWGGAWSIGPRYFVDVIPYLMYFLIPVFQMGAWARPALRVSFAAAVLFSTLVQYRSSTSPYPFMWNGKPRALVEAPERKWDWGDLQFLRGLCANNPLEGRAPACWFEHTD